MAENKKYYWLKLKKDFFKRHDIMIIESMPNGKEYALFYLKLLLESIDHDGALRFSESIPYDERMISTITNTNIDIVRSAMNIFQTLNLVEIQDDKTIFMNEVNKMLGFESQWAEKKRQYRLASNYQNEDNARTMSSECLPNVSQEKEIDIEKEKEIDKDIDIDKENALQSNGNVTHSNVTVTENNEDNGKKKRKTDISLDQYNLGESLDSAIRDFIENRKQLKAPMTQRALDIMIKKLFEMTNTESEMIAILEQSITSGYKGIFPVKKQSVSKGDENIRRIMDL